MTDVLAQLLTRAQARATLFATARLPPVWGVRFPAGPGAYFHTVHGAEGWLLVDGAAPRRVGADDVVLLTRGSAHRICSGPEGTIRTVFDPVSWQPNVVVPLAGAGGPRAVTLVCGAVRARDRADVLEFLPDVVHVRRDEQGGAELALTLRQLFAETAHPGGSSAELLARLGDVLLLQIVRHWL